MQARPDLPGQTHLISAFADLLFDGIIRQNQPFWRWRRHLGLFAAHVLEYSPALDARKARPARQRARPFGPPSGRFPRKKCHFPCRHAKILLQPLRRRSFSRRRTCEPYGSSKPLTRQRPAHFPGFSRHQPSACASLRRSKGGFASFLFCPRSIGE